MTNLLEETKFAIARSGHTEADIVFIGSQKSGHECTWAEFCELADVEYDSGFGSPKVPMDLIVVFGDGDLLYRSEYDGAENWEIQTPFARPNRKLPITALLSDGWSDLAEVQPKHVPPSESSAILSSKHLTL